MATHFWMNTTAYFELNQMYPIEQLGGLAALLGAWAENDGVIKKDHKFVTKFPTQLEEFFDASDAGFILKSKWSNLAKLNEPEEE